MQNVLLKYTNRIVPFHIEETSIEECITFNIKQLLSVVINTYKLDNIGKVRSLIFAVASDGAKITNYLH